MKGNFLKLIAVVSWVNQLIRAFDLRNLHHPASGQVHRSTIFGFIHCAASHNFYFYILVWLVMFCFLIVINLKWRKFFWKFQNNFRRNRSTTPRESSKNEDEKKKKKLVTTDVFVDFAWEFDSIHKREIFKMQLAYFLPKETDTDLMMLYKIRKQRFSNLIVRQTSSTLSMVSCK